MKRMILGLLLAGVLAAGTMGEGSLDVAAAGTAKALAASQDVLWVIVQCNDDNAGACFVGSQAVDSTSGVKLQPGDSVTLWAVGTAQHYNLARIFVDVATNGDGVTYLWLSK